MNNQLKNKKSRTYSICQDASRFFESSSKVHAYLDSDLRNMLCGFRKNLSLSWRDCRCDKHTENLSEIIKHVSCKKCILKAKKILSND